MSNHVAMSGYPAIPQDELPIPFVDLGRRGGTTKPLATRTFIRYSGEVSRPGEWNVLERLVRSPQERTSRRMQLDRLRLLVSLA